MLQAEKWIEPVIQKMQSFGASVEPTDEHVYLVNQVRIEFVPAGLPAAVHDAAIVVHEDLFHSRKEQLFMRLKSQLGLNTKRIHGRQTKLKEISRNEAEAFVNQNHLMGFGGGKTFLGLFYHDQLVAAAVFSKVLFMKYENPSYYSTELERYCSLADTTVVGGLDKFIRYFEKNFQTDDLVTTIDLEWSAGKSYINLGFEEVARTKTILFAVDQTTFLRRVVESEADRKTSEYCFQNKGNLKLRKRIAR